MFKKETKSEETTWLSLSDMMTVLMVLFMILAIFIALNATKTLSKVIGVVDMFIENENKLCEELKDELFTKFNRNDLKISCEPIRITFINEKYKFEHDSHELNQEFKATLRRFFPIYLDIINDWKFVNLQGEIIDLTPMIDEVRIEGHTDSAGAPGTSVNSKYIYNMGLSQRRSKEVLNFVFNLKSLKDRSKWMRDTMTANGLSFSRRLNTKEELFDNSEKDQIEDKKASRRIEIKLRTKARELIKELREAY
jgi:outer membrane protein OmpA-like peptidoglycan-associated protein